MQRRLYDGGFYNAYDAFCTEEGGKPMGKTTFADRVRARGLHTVRGVEHVLCVCGLGLTRG